MTDPDACAQCEQEHLDMYGYLPLNEKCRRCQRQEANDRPYWDLDEKEMAEGKS